MVNPTPRAATRAATSASATASPTSSATGHGLEVAAPRRPRRSATGPAARRPVGPAARSATSAVRERGGIGGGDAVDEVLQHRLQRGDRRAQLVRDVRDQLPALLVGGGEIGGHLVERDGELAHLVARRGPHPPRVVAPGHRPGRGGHLPQRPGHPVREHLRGEQHDRHRDQRDADRRLPPVLVVEVGEPGGAGGQQQDADLQLDRADRVERARQQLDDRRRPLHDRHLGTSSAYPTPCTVRIRSAPELAAQRLDVAVDRARAARVRPAPDLRQQRARAAAPCAAGPRGAPAGRTRSA